MIDADQFDVGRVRGWRLIAAWGLLLMLSFCLVLGAVVAGRMVIAAVGVWADPAAIRVAAEPNRCATF